MRVIPSRESTPPPDHMRGARGASDLEAVRESGPNVRRGQAQLDVGRHQQTIDQFPSRPGRSGEPIERRTETPGLRVEGTAAAALVSVLCQQPRRP